MEETRSGGVTLGLIARGTLVVLGIYALASALWLGRDILFVAFFAVLVASLLAIPVGWAERLGLPRSVAAPIILLLAIGLLILAATALWPTVREQLSVVRADLPAAVDQLGRWAERQYQIMTGQLGRPDDKLVEMARQRATAEAAGVIGGAIPLLNTLAGAVFGVFVVLFAALFMAIEPHTYARGVALLVPRRSRRRVLEAMIHSGEMLRRWMVGAVISMVIIGVLTTAGLLLLGIPAALVLGILAGLLEFVPYYGPILSAVPAIAVAFTVSPTTALWVALLYLVIQQLEGSVVHPLVMRGAVELPPALTIIWSTLMAVLFGFLGLLLAVPMLAVGKTLVERLYIEEVTEADTP